MIRVLVAQAKSGGVYDFSRRLVEALGDERATLSHLGKNEAEGWEVDPGDCVILQMSGYGFERRGAPLWLLRALEERRARISRLGVFFHELFAFGPPWSSSFWLSPFQRHISRRLAEMSDFWMTSREGSAAWLRRFANTKANAVLPVFSSVGESIDLPSTRERRVIVFGSPELRFQAYQSSGDALFAWANQHSLEIHDVGAPFPKAQPLSKVMRKARVVQHGLLASHDVSSLMVNARFGLVAYPVEYVAKSSVFAAYCAHGLCPILLKTSPTEADGLVPFLNYLPKLPSLAIDAETVGRNAWEWYQPHNLHCHADLTKSFSRCDGA